jgi:hypothetical protein
MLDTMWPQALPIPELWDANRSLDQPLLLFKDVEIWRASSWPECRYIKLDRRSEGAYAADFRDSGLGVASAKFFEGKLCSKSL